MNTTEKGNELEEQFYSYLQDQIDRNKLVFGVYPAMLCQLYKNKKYYCDQRKADVDFDVVIEVCREGLAEPHIVVVFECKNHKSPLQEPYITDFSDKIGRIFGHGAKGIIVSSSRLQSGAENVARSRRLGIVKFDESGFEAIAERKGRTWTETAFLENQVFYGSARAKTLKFSAYFGGKFFGSVAQMLQSFEPSLSHDGETTLTNQFNSVPYVNDEEIREIALDTLSLLKHTRGAVDLQKLCALLDIDLSFFERMTQDSDGNQILGSANFGTRRIEVNLHGNSQRERFTIAHEIGHFCLGHDQYLLSDSVVEHDLLAVSQSESAFNFERLEYQANIFASELLLPYGDFLISVEALRLHIGIYDRGFGYIFVDDQTCNYIPYNELLSSLSNHYQVSRQAIEIRLKRIGLVTDKRKNGALRTVGTVDWRLGH